jgi:hypothetical protein
MMKKKLEIIVACLIILFSAISHSAEKKNMDVVLVMDSTGSMKKTDPLFLRIPAAKLFISLLDKNDRAGVISFSDSAELLSSSVLVDSDNGKNTLFQAVDKITSAGLHTNLYEALNKGIEVLGAEKRPGSEKIIVLMSDGIMDTGDPEKDKALIEKLKTDLTKMLIDNGIKVYAIAFTGQSDTQLLEGVSKQTGGFYNLAMTDRDFHVVFASIFESLKAPDMLPMSGNGFLIDKSIEEVTIVTTKDSPDTTIKLSAPDGKKYSSGNKPPDTEWFASSNFDMMTIKKPLEGKWEILFSTGKNNKAYVITNLNLQTNFNELYPLFGQNLDVRVWLERDGKTIKEKEVLEKITISLELSKPDGEMIRLQPFNKEDGTFEKSIELFNAGNYKLKLVADGKTFQREKTFAFKVSDVKESQEDIKLRKSLKKPETQIPPNNNMADQVHWGKIIAQFMIINLAAGIIVLVYLKRRSFKKISDVKKLLKLSAIKGLFKKKNKEQGPGEVKEEQIQQLAREEEREKVHAKDKDIQETEESRKVDEKKREIALEKNREIDTVTETKIHATGNEEEKQDIEPEAEALNEGQEEPEISASSEDSPVLTEQEEKAERLQDEMNDEVHEAADKKVEEINELEQVNLETLIEQMEREQQGRTDKKGEDNDTN